MSPTNPGEPPPQSRCPLPPWARRLGFGAFLFFLVKGLLWLIVPSLVALGFLR